MHKRVNILQLHNNRRAVAVKLAKQKPSRSRSTLIALLKMKKPKLLQAVADNWFQIHYGIKALNTDVKIPKPLMPDLNEHDFFQLITDELKRSI